MKSADKVTLGRKSKLTPRNIELAIMLREKGFSIEEIAKALGVAEATLYHKNSEWEKLRKDLNAIRAKQEAEELGKVKTALYNRAIGQKVKTIKEVVTKNGDIVELKEVKEIAGDVNAQKFYLCNRDPENWKMLPTENDGNNSESDGIIKIEIVGDN